MEQASKQHIIDQSWDIHALVESAYLSHPSKKGQDDWLDKQRLLLADMAIHLLQTSLQDNQMNLDKLRNNLNAILTISDQFLPDAGLKTPLENLYNPAQPQK